MVAPLFYKIAQSAYSSPDKIPAKYLKGLNKEEKKEMIKEIMDQPNSYKD